MKKNFIRLTSITLALLLSLTALWSCGASNMAPDANGPSYNDPGATVGKNDKPSAYPPVNEDAEMVPGDSVEGDASFDESIGSNEEYADIVENGFIKVSKSPLSTFSADVDTASYTNVRRMINAGYKLTDIPKNSVRTEEFLNYFSYDYALPKDGEPFGVSVSIAPCPWNAENMLAIFGFRTEDISREDSDKPANLVFLIDVSGSMRSADKLPLLQQAFSALTESLDGGDTVSIVTYSGREEVVLDGCPGSDGTAILNAINSLNANGSTNGQAGLEKAYQLAQKHFKEDGTNRIIMASDGDLNVGISSATELENYVSEMRESGVYLSVLGFGSGNYKDDRMEALADNGNGNYFYIDSVGEAEKVLRDDLNATINTVADDVKLQVDFNGEYVDSYRLIGYENRSLNNEDFTDDTKDAGEVGSGHIFTVAYELIPAETPENPKYNEWMTVAVNYKEPGESVSKTLEYPITVDAVTDAPSDDWYFAAAVIEFCMVLRDSKYKGDVTLDSVLSLLSDVDLGGDTYKQELVSLIVKLGGVQSDEKDSGSRYD